MIIISRFSPIRQLSSRTFNQHHAIQSEAEELTQLCKALEHKYERELDSDIPFVIRLDGVGFRRLTNNLKKPFDERFTRAMLLTTKDLLQYLPASTAFCQSDEVSLFFFPGWGPIPYNGRTQKLSSITAGFASAAFSRHFQLKRGWFDARVFSCPNAESALKVMHWRHRHDCRRNAVNAAGAANFTHRELQGLRFDELIGKLKAERGIDFYSDYPPEAIYGVFMKRFLYEHVGYNPITKEHVKTMRTRIDARCVDLSSRSDPESLDILQSRHWASHHPSSIKPVCCESECVEAELNKQ